MNDRHFSFFLSTFSHLTHSYLSSHNSNVTQMSQPCLPHHHSIVSIPLVRLQTKQKVTPAALCHERKPRGHCHLEPHVTPTLWHPLWEPLSSSSSYSYSSNSSTPRGGKLLATNFLEKHSRWKVNKQVFSVISLLWVMAQEKINCAANTRSCRAG